jgi:hypothetical protein
MAIVTPQVLAAGHGAMVLDLHREMVPSIIGLIIVLKLIACLSRWPPASAAASFSPRCSSEACSANCLLHCSHYSHRVSPSIPWSAC